MLINFARFSTFILAFLTWLAPQQVQGQHCTLHTDKAFYVNGEVIWYALYLAPEFQGQNTAVRVSLHDYKGKEIQNTFHKSEANNQVNGYLKVPFDLKTGWYQLSFQSLQASTRLPVVLHNQTFPIYNDNDIRKLEGQMEELPSSDQTIAELESELSVSLSSLSGKVEPRGESTIQVVVKDKAGNPITGIASVAVTNWSMVAPAVGTYSGMSLGEELTGLNASDLLGKVYKRIQIVDDQGNPRVANVIGAWSGQENKMLYSTRANQEGISLLRLDDFTGEKTIQYLGYDKEKEDIITRDIVNVQPALMQNMTVTPGLLTYLQKSQQRKKIFQYYKQLEFDMEVEASDVSRNELKGNQTFRVPDYEEFDNFATFFQENLSPIRFGEDRKNNKYTTYMYNPRNNRQNNRFPGNPLFIVDGKVTRDADFVGRLDLGGIENVKLFFRQESLRSLFNVMGANGVVMIEYMPNSDEVQLPEADEANRYRVSGLQRKATFPVFDPASLLERQPFFRPQLFWDPEVAIDKDGMASIRYNQSDAYGTFRVEVVVQDETGKMGYQTLFLEVEQRQ